MKRLILALLVTGMAASPVLAQDYSKHTVTGTVVAASSDSLVVDTAAGRMTFKLDSMLDHVRYDGLKTGSNVEVTHRLDELSGRQAVTYVTLVQDPAMSTYDKTGSQATSPVPGDTYTVADARRDESNRLPATASPFAALALLSLIAVLGGLGLWVYSQGTRFGRAPATPSLGRGVVRS